MRRMPLLRLATTPDAGSVRSSRGVSRRRAAPAPPVYLRPIGPSLMRPHDDRAEGRRRTTIRPDRERDKGRHRVFPGKGVAARETETPVSAGGIWGAGGSCGTGRSAGLADVPAEDRDRAAGLPGGGEMFVDRLSPLPAQ